MPGTIIIDSSLFAVVAVAVSLVTFGIYTDRKARNADQRKHHPSGPTGG